MLVLAFDRLLRAIGERLDSGDGVPLLVLRLPEFEQIAWRDGRRSALTLERQTIAAFRRAARRILREGDALAHEIGTDRFVVAMLSPARAGHPPQSHEVRSALERIAAAMSVSTGRRMQTGWWPVETRAEIEAIEATLDAALERGLRERERGEMLATVGHELRTPLTSIRGYIETLLDGELDSSTARRFLETARREALRLGRLVEGMLEFSMLDLSTRRRDARCDVAEQVRATIDAIVPLAHERRITVRARLPQEASARVDGDACMHALLNLVENAIKCGREGGTVEIGCAREDAFVCVSVDDDGPGIAPDERESIFKMGIRGGAVRHSGTGIGLAVVRAIVDRAGGDVRVLASPLGGARFAIRFPAD
jgi:two-component system phosphate regulon sensor histidine kinase PhoR